jgi:hypothetical protein
MLNFIDLEPSDKGCDEKPSWLSLTDFYLSAEGFFLTGIISAAYLDASIFFLRLPTVLPIVTLTYLLIPFLSFS